MNELGKLATRINYGRWSMISQNQDPRQNGYWKIMGRKSKMKNRSLISSMTTLLRRLNN